jgi:S-adenosylmethionine hydrolase
VGQILTVTTDFGTSDAYVAAMKGTILGIAKDLTLIDISHEISPQDVMEAAFVVANAAPYFPPETIHLVVVDPGVGTDRRPIALRIDDHWFVGADNGLFSLLAEERSPAEAIILDNPSFWRTSDPSTTFHGRDIFAPVAAHLGSGVSPSELGTPIDPEKLEYLRWARPTIMSDGIRGWIVHIDRFGNCITNISRSLYEEEQGELNTKLYAGSAVIEGIANTYDDVEKGEPLALFGSSGYLEIAVNAGNAAELYSIMKSDPVNIVFSAE